MEQVEERGAVGRGQVRVTRGEDIVGDPVPCVQDVFAGGGEVVLDASVDTRPAVDQAQGSQPAGEGSEGLLAPEGRPVGPTTHL
ncbi:hypothetical protein ACWGIU_20580 [Streptomyces sp. NPDC054840]